MALVRDPAPSLTILRNPDQTVSLSWSGAGALEQTDESGRARIGSRPPARPIRRPSALLTR